MWGGVYWHVGAALGGGRCLFSLSMRPAAAQFASLDLFRQVRAQALELVHALYRAPARVAGLGFGGG